MERENKSPLLLDAAQPDLRTVTTCCILYYIILLQYITRKCAIIMLLMELNSLLSPDILVISKILTSQNQIKDVEIYLQKLNVELTLLSN